MSKTTLIKLKPFDYYFFGGEETFNSGAKGIVNYHVKSNLLPQQTGLLGFLRHALFGLYKIGQSFDGSHSDFGDIKSISPLFLMNSDEDIILPAPSNINPKGCLINVRIENKNALFVNNNWNGCTIETLNYNAKYGTGKFWLSVNNSQLIDSDHIFISKEHIGINKQKHLTNRADEGAFYKQQFITLADSYQFAVIAELDELVDLKKLPRQLPLGGEKRLFHITYSADSNVKGWDAIKNSLKTTYASYAEKNTCIILLSDAYVKDLNTFHQHLQFGFMQEVPFRNIITPFAIKNFARLTKNKLQTDQLYKNDKVSYLIKRGSVLYAAKPNITALEQLLNNEIFQDIGYNHYLTFNQ